MKTIRYYLIPLILFIVPILVSYRGVTCNQVNSFIHQDSTVIGTWISEKDANWKLEFKSDSTCISSYTGYDNENNYYHISNTSPQCGHAVETGPIYNYLQLTNVSDSTDKICYLINGITDTHLSISPINLGGAFVFVKQ